MGARAGGDGLRQLYGLPKPYKFALRPTTLIAMENASENQKLASRAVKSLILMALLGTYIAYQ